MTTAEIPASARLQIIKLEDELKLRQAAVVCAFTELLDLRDIETGVHSTRLAEWAMRIGERLGLPDSQLEQLEIAALLHDVGKVGVRDEILHKPGKLTAQERAELEKHSEYGWAILRRIPGLEMASLYVLHHHERIDGTGYPSRLAGADIPLGARIVAILDAFDAMVSDRCYRRAFTVEVALQRLQEAAGTQFDAAIVKEFSIIAAAHADEISAAISSPPVVSLS